jgi:hypothetical protein
MAHIAIELEWPRDPEGYRLIETGRPKTLRIVRNGAGKGPEHHPLFHPLASTDLLFGVFANNATTAEGALDFVTRYGPLTYDGWDAMGDEVDRVTHDAERMREVLKVWVGKQKKLQIPFRPSSKRTGKPLIIHPHDTGPSSSLNAAVVWDPATKALKWEFRSNTLLDALWLQLAQALTSATNFRQCEKCDRFFTAGRGTGRRLDAKFCSDEHRIAFNSEKRSREK